ncbi:hypothetical protein [Kineosporia sp. R_H_3]|uniref:hypothetical protein n=1 Tax=Kineosporia sp. R_H_3 TaxID=1961848 RepID=UPI000B4B16A1|nr:hypothetical protein [Kineosporia sp. R_H_3]
MKTTSGRRTDRAGLPALAPRSWVPHGWGLLFLAAGLWTLLGAVPGLVDPAAAYQRFHAGPVTEDVLALFRGSSGQTFLFGVGYVVAAFAPRRHALVVALGGAGKAVYAVRLLSEAAAGQAGPLTLVAAVGDLAFVAAFVAFFATGITARRAVDRPAGPASGATR